jgi:hypothetical protein
MGREWQSRFGSWRVFEGWLGWWWSPEVGRLRRCISLTAVSIESWLCCGFGLVGVSKGVCDFVLVWCW